jgi:hypothetical protein
MESAGDEFDILQKTLCRQFPLHVRTKHATIVRMSGETHLISVQVSHKKAGLPAPGMG